MFLQGLIKSVKFVKINRFNENESSFICLLLRKHGVDYLWNSINLKNTATRPIDHIVYTVPNLEEAIVDFEKKLGVKPVFGGYHKTQGTKNALVNLGNGRYLELLAADATNTDIPLPRWMGVDLLTKPQITRWALKSKNLETDSEILKAYDPEMGSISGGSRSMPDGSVLKWKLTMPLATPEVEIIPFLLDWSATEKHPSELLPEMACALVALYATHPNPERFTEVFKKLHFNFKIERSDQIGIRCTIQCPNGLVDL